MWKSSMYAHCLQYYSTMMPHLVFNGCICSCCAEFLDHLFVPSSLYCIHKSSFSLLQKRWIGANAMHANNMTTLVYSAFLYNTSCAEKKTHLAFDIQDCIAFHQHFNNFQVTMLGSSHEGSHSILNHECIVYV